MKSDLQVSIRRVDGKNLTEKEVDEFNEFFRQNVLSNSLYVKWLARFCGGGYRMAFAMCDYLGYFDKNDLAQYAQSHPEHQIEVIVECDEHADQRRILYQGDIIEEMNEIRTFPEPTQIAWSFGE